MPYTGTEGLFQIWKEAMSFYRLVVVDYNIHYQSFADDFINSRIHHDFTDADSKSDHSVILGRIRKLLQYEELIKKYYNRPLTEENFISCMYDLMVNVKQTTSNLGHNFQCHFNRKTINVITEAVNSIGLFKEEVKAKDMDRFFNECKSNVVPAFHSRNNQHIAYFLNQMDSYGLISRNYQYVIEVNRLIIGPKTGKLLTAHSLTCALSQINAVNNPIKTKIEEWVKKIKYTSLESGI